jgi:regulator of protease activity HflC (stomatin/prohibitin superfamily)
MFAPLYLISFMGLGITALLVLLFIILVVSNIIIVPQASAYVIERLGAYQQTWGTGLHFKIPLIDRVANKVTMKERIADFKPQPVITRDNVTMQIDTVVYFFVSDPKLYTYGVVQPLSAIENLTATTLRNLIGELELDQTLTSRDIINSKMRAILDEATDPWGIKVNRVELKNIIPPKEIQDAMERQMKAERERREAILKAEGEKKSAILIAEGERESAILRADAEKQAAILKAEAEKEAAILKADGEAQAIRTVQQALADSLGMLNEKAPNEQVIKLKSIQAMEKVADGKATKIIIPSEMQGLVGMAKGLVEGVKE